MSSVGDLGESGLLDLIGRRLPSGFPGDLGPGDDAAVVAVPSARMVLSADMLVEGVDFDLSYWSGGDIGWKAVAVNVSDIAAMGARPAHLLASIGMPAYTSVGVFEGVLDGMIEAASAAGATIVGGDISGASELVLSVAITGSCERDPVLRSSAAPGQVLCVTGSLGGSAGGLAVLQGRTPGPAPGARQRHLRPPLRVDEGAALAECGATAMIDVSDGFGLDLSRLLESSGAGCRVDPAAIPIDPSIAHLPDALELALGGGEDFELIAALPESNVGRAVEALDALGTALAVVGEVSEGEMLLGQEPLQGSRYGWEHLR